MYQFIVRTLQHTILQFCFCVDELGVVCFLFLLVSVCFLSFIHIISILLPFVIVCLLSPSSFACSLAMCATATAATVP